MGNHRSGNRKENRGTKIEIEARLLKMAEWLYDNPTARRGDFANWAHAEFGITKDFANKSKKAAYAKLIELNKNSIEAKRVQQLSALEKLLHKAQDKNDIKTELLIIQEINKASNLYITKTEVTEKKDIPMFVLDDNKLKKAE